MGVMAKNGNEKKTKQSIKKAIMNNNIYLLGREDHHGKWIIRVQKLH